MSLVIPSLPQKDSATQQAARAFQLSVAGTSFNYMNTYMLGVALSADLPEGEEFNTPYKLKLIPIVATMMANLIANLEDMLEEEKALTKKHSILDRIRDAAKELIDFQDTSISDKVDAIGDIFDALDDIPEALGVELRSLPSKLQSSLKAIKKLAKEVEKNGPTAILKSSMWDLLSATDRREILEAETWQRYKQLFQKIPTPLMLQIDDDRKPWMADAQFQCMEDWFLGYLQVGGFNTTMLRGVRLNAPENTDIVDLDKLLTKFPVTDSILKTEVGDDTVSLKAAAEQNRLYVVDYACLEGASCVPVHGEERFLGAPMCLFYLNPNPPAGYPQSEGGALQPIAIQLLQSPDPVKAPLFTPKDAGNANDENGYKWMIAKYFVNVSNAIQHESVAHLGDCHLEIDPMVVAANRNFAKVHPLMVLLKPHFRFTININQSALHSLIIPGGVVATNVGPRIQDTWDMVAEAHKNWKFDDNNPEVLFARRGVDTLPSFPFRDDTMLLWQATFNWVSDYIDIYYREDDDVRQDFELQNWINEMVSGDYAGFKGFEHLEQNPESSGHPWVLGSVDYLKRIIAQIIYIAGPLHASVNFAQYPLMSFMPSVAGTIYEPAPGKDTVINNEEDCCKYYPPLDVSSYTYLFEYLLSSLQYDTFGYYDEGDEKDQGPYFDDTRVLAPLTKFQQALQEIETTITERNKTRPMEYPFQVPSKIPNSISI
ncbi:lipoxygenase family protein [Planctobacterium marinum]|uniref:lipoxygenase family protein n=1 Tax=Planctobacterium marinum TaxID=1631968 RepID=UPI001E642459|nr:lipoxygenase family protein [Planctobacterium marinum]MCC2604079.1 arachidonate 15-lipoxygenase [Planctobacterium marinum]